MGTKTKLLKRGARSVTHVAKVKTQHGTYPPPVFTTGKSHSSFNPKKVYLGWDWQMKVAIMMATNVCPAFFTKVLLK